MNTESINPVPPAKGLRAGAVLISGLLNFAGAALVVFAMPGTAGDARIAAGWALVQFISGVWAGVLGANSPFLHGLVAGAPALLLGLFAAGGHLPAQYVAVSWFLAPAAALLAAALMRYMRRRQ